jgi:serine/threonine-protein kinase HipA
MSRNNIIALYCFDHEIGKIGFDEQLNKSFFQYHPDFLKSGQYRQLFPLLIKRIEQTQVFDKFNNDLFRGLPPVIADSLPDMFGNLVFKTWLEFAHKDYRKISVLEQLTYVANRGMGALEYRPGKHIPKTASINLSEIAAVLEQVMENKLDISADQLDSAALLNIFKIGSSAGGARPKILISEHRRTGRIIPGDMAYSDDYYHYLVKLHLDHETAYNREIVEYCYYLTATRLGIRMMPSRLVDGQHFATQRFDRQDGHKKHILTASGMTGWNVYDPAVSSYENLFELGIFLKLPFKELDELFRRMIFNLVFYNTDDHLKNHAFIYDEVLDQWHLSPAYDLTYAQNPLLNYNRTSRALSINGKRTGIAVKDILHLAEQYTIKNPKGVIEQVQQAIPGWLQQASELNIPESVTQRIHQDFINLL